MDQEENWGIQPSKIIYYFGISKKNSKSDSFSEHLLNPSDLSIDYVIANFKNSKEDIKNRIEFRQPLELTL